MIFILSGWPILKENIEEISFLFDGPREKSNFFSATAKDE